MTVTLANYNALHPITVVTGVARDILIKYPLLRRTPAVTLGANAENKRALKIMMTPVSTEALAPRSRTSLYERGAQKELVEFTFVTGLFGVDIQVLRQQLVNIMSIPNFTTEEEAVNQLRMKVDEIFKGIMTQYITGNPAEDANTYKGLKTLAKELGNLEDIKVRITDTESKPQVRKAINKIRGILQKYNLLLDANVAIILDGIGEGVLHDFKATLNEVIKEYSYTDEYGDFKVDTLFGKPMYINDAVALTEIDEEKGEMEITFYIVRFSTGDTVKTIDGLTFILPYDVVSNKGSDIITTFPFGDANDGSFRSQAEWDGGLAAGTRDAVIQVSGLVIVDAELVEE